MHPKDTNVYICNIESILKFLTNNPNVNLQYSQMFNQFFPEQKKVFFKKPSKMTDLEKKYKEIMIKAINKYGNFDMRKYYKYLKSLLPDYGIKDIRIFLLINICPITYKLILIGCGTISLHMNHVNTMLSDICIKKGLQGKGYGKHLTSLLIDYVKKMSKNSGKNKILLDVKKDNVIATRMYKKFGFQILDSYYDNIKMELKLK